MRGSHFVGKKKGNDRLRAGIVRQATDRATTRSVPVVPIIRPSEKEFPISQLSLADRTGLTQQGAGYVIARLIKVGAIRKTTDAKTNRKPAYYRWNPNLPHCNSATTLGKIPIVNVQQPESVLSLGRRLVFPNDLHAPARGYDKRKPSFKTKSQSLMSLGGEGQVITKAITTQKEKRCRKR
jgi:hypothetical protein